MYTTHHDVAFSGPHPVHRAKRSRPVFICCGSMGLVLGVLGGIILGVGHQRLRANPDNKDYSYILVGSVVFAVGVILTVLAFFLSISWSSLGSTSKASNLKDSQQLHEHYPGDWQDSQSPVNSQYGTAVCE